ncbi:hypothetical protein CW304_25405 [Bacillus sp. UFRGS-B20]|nr:hypothetical protein CW304_25405 [Bacillus sp. UFRGS-B20]
MALLTILQPILQVSFTFVLKTILLSFPYPNFWIPLQLLGPFSKTSAYWLWFYTFGFPNYLSRIQDYLVMSYSIVNTSRRPIFYLFLNVIRFLPHQTLTIGFY